MVDAKKLPNQLKSSNEDKKAHSDQNHAMSITCCYVHPKVGAKYLCENCNQSLCSDCWLQHQDDKPDHNIINCDEKGRILLKQMKQISEEGLIKNITGNIFCHILSKMQLMLKELDVKIVENLKEFAGASHLSMKSINLKEIEKKMEKMKENSDFVELYKLGKSTLEGILIPKNVSYETLHKKIMLIAEEFVKKCDKTIKEAIGMKEEVIDTNKKFTKPDIPRKKEKEKDQIEKTEIAKKILKKYEESEILCIDQNDNEEVISILKNAKMSKYKIIKVGFYSRKNINDDVAKIIAEIIKTYQNLESFYLGGDNISDKGAELIANAVQNNSHLISFHLYGGNISDKGAELIANAVQNNSHLTSFYLGGDNISDKGAELIANAVQNNSHLTSFYLSGDNISDKGAELIANAVQNNSHLTSFYLGGSDISDKGAELIANAVQNNSHLISFCLYGGNISNKGAELIANAVQNNNHLTSFYLCGDNISDKGTELIANAVQNNSHLISFCLYGDNISDKGTELIANAVQNNNNLTSFYFGSYNISDKGFLALCNVAKKHKSLQEMNVILGSTTEVVLNLCLQKIFNKEKVLKVRIQAEYSIKEICTQCCKKNHEGFKELKVVDNIYDVFMGEIILSIH